MLFFEGEENMLLTVNFLRFLVVLNSRVRVFIGRLFHRLSGCMALGNIGGCFDLGDLSDPSATSAVLRE